MLGELKKMILKTIFLFFSLFLFSLPNPFKKAKANEKDSIAIKNSELQTTKETFLNEKNKALKKENPSKVFNEKNFSILYHEAIRNYQEKKWDQAREIFSEILETKDLEKNINPSSLFYNIGLNEYQTKNYAKALGWFRKAIFSSPLLFKARKAIHQSELQLKMENKKGLWHMFRNRVFSYFSLNTILTITFLFLSFFLFLMFRPSKTNFETEVHSKNQSIFSTLHFLSAFLLLISLTLSGFKIYDSLNPWATVISPEAKLRVAPGAENNILLDLKPGTEVLLKEKKDEWLRVLSSKGTMGWIEESFLFQTTGFKLSP